MFYHPKRGLLVLSYVDDLLIIGESEDIEWFLAKLVDRFKCKDPFYLTETEELDYLGIQLRMNNKGIHLSMEDYITNAKDIMQWKSTAKVPSTPINEPVNTDSEALNALEHKHFLTGVGMIGWLSITARPDVSYAFSRIAQHSANPTKSALEAVYYVFRYLEGTIDYGIGCNNAIPDKTVLNFMNTTTTEEPEWRFYSDSDHGGNAENQNKRRSQYGFIATCNNTPVAWYSKATSVAFASKDIGEAHADISSAASEIYAAGNATMETLGLSYVVDEMGISFPKPFTLEIDNNAAITFAFGNALKTKLKHIDSRQHWVRTLRDRQLLTVRHIPSKENLSDLFTKILDKAVFLYLRDQCMVKFHSV